MSLLNLQAMRENGCVLNLPLKSSVGVGYFDGSNDYLYANNMSNIGTSTATFEFWWYCLSTPIGNFDIINHAGQTPRLMVYFSNSSKVLYFSLYNGATYTISFYNSFTPTGGNWYHIAWVKNGSTWYAFVNGVSQTITVDGGSASNNLDTCGASMYIAYASTTAGYLTGYITELRISNSARYTSAFTPQPLSNTLVDDSSTLLLLHMKSSIADDNSSGRTAKTVSASGATILANRLIPDHSKYTDVKISGSLVSHSVHDATVTGNCTMYVGKDGQGLMYFDGTGDYVTWVYDSESLMGANDFTIALWANMSTVNALHTLFHLYAATNSGIEIYTSASAKLCAKVSDTSTAGNMISTTGSATLSASTWYHIALVRSGSTFTLYLNAASDSTGTSSATIITPTACCIGARYNAGTPDQLLTGYIRDVRVFKGRVLDTVAIRSLMEETRPDYI